MLHKTILLALAIFTFLSCGNDGPHIDGDLVPYFDRFTKEAALRDVVIDFSTSNVEARIVKILNEQVLGQCVYAQEVTELNQIHISNDFWASSNEIEKEFVVFHELGHCILNRDHTNVADSNGDCLSIMYDGFSPDCFLNYNVDNREALLDELFR